MIPLKILLGGLANAGKSSILRVLDNDLESIPKLTPTLGVEYKNYKVMGLDVTAWDLGGQTRYREKYLLDFQKTFQESSIVFFVIDFQSEGLYAEVLTYLKGIVAALKKLNLTNVYIPILFHKIDPHIRTKPEDLNPKIAALRARIEKVLGKIDHAYYETSMYEPYTIFKAFSESILHRVTGAELITQKLGDIAIELKSDAATLITAAGYVYGAWHSKGVQITDLVKFYRAVQEFSHVLSDKDNPPVMTFQLTEVLDIAAVIFSHNNNVVTFCMMTARMQAYDKLKEELLHKQDELKKVLQLLQQQPVVIVS